MELIKEVFTVFFPILFLAVMGVATVLLAGAVGTFYYIPIWVAGLFGVYVAAVWLVTGFYIQARWL